MSTLLPDAALDAESSIELPTNEKLPAEVILLIVFFNRSRVDAGAPRPSNAESVERKISSHWA